MQLALASLFGLGLGRIMTLLKIAVFKREGWLLLVGEQRRGVTGGQRWNHSWSDAAGRGVGIGHHRGLRYTRHVRRQIGDSHIWLSRGALNATAWLHVGLEMGTEVI